MLQGCFSSSCTGNLQHVEGKMNKLKYQEILEKNVMPSVKRLKLGHNCTFSQDNDPKSTPPGIGYSVDHNHLTWTP